MLPNPAWEQRDVAGLGYLFRQKSNILEILAELKSTDTGLSGQLNEPARSPAI